MTGREAAPVACSVVSAVLGPHVTAIGSGCGSYVFVHCHKEKVREGDALVSFYNITSGPGGGVRRGGGEWQTTWSLCYNE